MPPSGSVRCCRLVKAPARENGVSRTPPFLLASGITGIIGITTGTTAAITGITRYPRAILNMDAQSTIQNSAPQRGCSKIPPQQKLSIKSATEVGKGPLRTIAEPASRAPHWCVLGLLLQGRLPSTGCTHSVNLSLQLQLPFLGLPKAPRWTTTKRSTT